MNKEELIKHGIDQIIIKGNLDEIKTVFSEDYVAHAGDKKYQGHDFLKRWTKQFHSSISNIQAKEILILSQDEERITWQRSMTGKHVKNLRGIPASNKKISWTEMVVSRFENNKIVEEWLVSELAAALMVSQAKNK